MDLDGREVDIRFLLQSWATLKPDEIPGTSYEPYVNILKAASNEEKRFNVDENLWKDVTIIRCTKSTKFRACADVDNDFLSALIVYLNEVTELSRPCVSPGDFMTKATRWEVSLKIPVPENFGIKATFEKFLHQLWDFAFALSTCMSNY